MKKNKLIFLAIFLLVFLGFISEVSAKACIYIDGGLKWEDMEYNQSTNRSCNDAHKGQWARDDAITNAYLQGIEKVCAKKTGGTYEYRATIYSLETANACSDNGYTWKNVSDIIKEVYSLTDNTSNSSNNTETKTDCSIPENICKNLPNYKYGNGCCTWNAATSTSNNSNNTETKTDCNIPENTCSQLPNGRMENGCCKWDTYTPTPSSNPNQPAQERTGTDQDYNNGGKPTDPYPYMKVDLGCDGMKDILGLIKTIYNLIRYATPLVLIILGSVDFMKAVMAGKEDDIKKNQHRFVSRLILAVGVFLLLSVFQLITNILSSAGTEDGDAWYNCWNSLMIMFK